MEQDGDAEALRTLLDNLDQLTFVLDGSRTFLYANAPFLSFMQSEGCAGMTAQAFIDEVPEKKDRRECFLKNVIGSIDPSRGVFCPGIGRWFKISVNPIKWKGQDATSYLAQDITEEKREEDIRYERNIAYDILTKRFNVTIWEYDKDTHTVSMVQKDAADTFGKMHQPDVIEDVPYSLVPNVDERDVDKFVRMYTSIDAGMKKADSKVMLINPITHESFFLHIILTTFTDYQGKERVVGCGIDISTSQREEEKYRRLKKQLSDVMEISYESALLDLAQPIVSLRVSREIVTQEAIAAVVARMERAADKGYAVASGFVSKGEQAVRNMLCAKAGARLIHVRPSCIPNARFKPESAYVQAFAEGRCLELGKGNDEVAFGRPACLDVNAEIIEMAQAGEGLSLYFRREGLYRFGGNGTGPRADAHPRGQ